MIRETAWDLIPKLLHQTFKPTVREWDPMLDRGYTPKGKQDVVLEVYVPLKPDSAKRKWAAKAIRGADVSIEYTQTAMGYCYRGTIR